jgi:hypothetical protein
MGTTRGFDLRTSRARSAFRASRARVRSRRVLAIPVELGLLAEGLIDGGIAVVVDRGLELVAGPDAPRPVEGQLVIGVEAVTIARYVCLLCLLCLSVI